MKKILIFLAIIVLLFIGTLAILPFVFKDDIKALVKDDVNKMLEAEVYFDDIGLSFLKDFPNACISIQDFGVVGKGLFEGDTLAQGKQFDLVVDIMSVINGEEIQLKKIQLDQPKIHAIVLADGTANWDIVKEDTVTSTEEDAVGSFKIALQGYQLTDATIIYDDATYPMNLSISGLNHEGSGDFTADTYDLRTETLAEKVYVKYDGITYLNQAKVDADVDMTIFTLPDLKVVLKENQITVNELSIGVDGSVVVPGDDINLDLTYKANKTSFRSILSLVPGVYTADFKDIETDGTLVFNGFVKGTYNEQRLPGFGVDLKIGNGRMKYPDVPKPITGINVDLSVNNPDGNLNNTAIDIRSFHADLGSNPIDGRAKINGLERMQVNGQLKATLNLEEITQMFPVEGTTLKGSFKVDAIADGVYDDAKGTFPKVNASMDMDNGYVKNAEYPAELTNLKFHAKLTAPTSDMKTVVFDMPDFHFELDGESIDGSAHVEDFDDPNYRLQATGKLDLEKVMQIYPIDSMTLRGKLNIREFSTSGRYSDIEAERYTKLPTSGKVDITDLYYSDLYYVQPGFTITNGTATFTPDRIQISSASGKLGKSDYRASGYFSNYLAYYLMQGEILKGNMAITSNKMDVNEWMVTETTENAATGETTEMEVIPIPGEYDLDFQANIGELIYDDLTLKNFKGSLEIVDKRLEFREVNFGMLGSTINLSGEYNTSNLKKPTYKFYMNIKQLSVPEAFTHFTALQSYAPVAKTVKGIANTEFGISGRLKPNMMPVLEDITSLGVFELLDGGIKGAKVLDAISQKTKINSLSNLSLENAVSGQFEIKDGFLNVKPFDLKFQGITVTIGGRQSLSQNLDYSVAIDAPAGKLGEAASSALSNLTGTSMKASDRINVNLKVGGTSDKPTISGFKGGDGVKDALKDKATELAEDKLKDELGKDVNLDTDSLKASAEAAKQRAIDSVKNAANQAKAQAKDSLDKVVNKAKEDAAKAVESEVDKAIGEEGKEALDKLKDIFGKKKKKKE